MIKKYNEYVIDSILETILYLSPNMKNVMRKIDSPISDDVMSLIGQDTKGDYTLLDVSKGNKVSFSKYKDVKKVLNKIFNNSDADGIFSTSLSDYQIDLLISKISKRSDMNFGRLINKLLSGKYSDSEVEKFINKYKALVSSDIGVFEIVEGEDIRKYFLESNYAYDTGVLANSCMRHKYCQDYFDIYVNNPQVCRLLILKIDDKIIGRALVWKVSSVEPDFDNIYVLDRIYTSDDSDINRFKTYAKDNGWMYRNKMGFSDHSEFVYNGSVIKPKLTVQLNKKLEYEKYPYMYTFKVYNVTNKTLINNLYSNTSDGSVVYTLTNSDGSYEEDKTTWSDYENRRIDSDDAVWVESLGSFIHVDAAAFVNIGSRAGEAFDCEDPDVFLDSFRDEYIHKDDVAMNKVENLPFYKEDAVITIYDIQPDLEVEVSDFSSHDIMLEPINNIVSSKYIIDKYKFIQYVHVNILRKSDINGMYYFKRLEIEVYKVDDTFGKTEIDCKILGIELNKKKIDSFYTDSIEYNMNIDFHNELIEKADIRDSYQKTRKESAIMWLKEKASL